MKINIKEVCKQALWLVLISVSCLSVQAYANTMTGNAGPCNGLLGPGTDGIVSNEAGNPLPAGSIVQYIYAGTDNVANPPTPTGGTTGTNLIIMTIDGVPSGYSTVGDETVTGSYIFSSTPGVFFHNFSGTYEASNPAPKVFIRAYNASSISSATRYGNSALFSPSTSGGPNDTFVASWSTNQTFTPPAGTPNITTVAPVAGDNSNRRITITGTNFGTPPGTANVKLYVLPAKTLQGTASIVSWTDTQIVCDIPTTISGKCEIDVTNNSALTGTWITFYHTVPYISNMSPATGTNGTLVTLTGSNFATATIVHFDAALPISLTSGQFTIVNPTTITFNVPGAAPMGSNDVYVTNPAGDSNHATFTISSVVPAFSSILPTSGNQGQTLIATIDGTNTNFSGSSVVTFSGTGVTAEIVGTPTLTRITCRIRITPAASPTGTARNVTVTTGGEIVTGTGVFTVNSVVVNNPPVVTPGTLQQYKADGATIIPSGGWINSLDTNSVVLKFSMTDPDSGNSVTALASLDSAAGILNPTGNTGITPVAGSVTVNGLADGSYNWRAQARDGGALTSSFVDFPGGPFDFRVDLTAPVNPTVPCVETHGAPDNNWQITDPNPSFSWTAGTDTGGSGVSGYAVYWGNDPAGDPGLVQTQPTTTYVAAPMALDTVNYLRIRTFDLAGNYSAPVTLFTFKYGNAPVTDIWEGSGGTMQAYPNPFNPLDTANPLKLMFMVPTGEAASVYIFDSNYRVIWQKVDTQNTHHRIVTWDGETAYGEVVENGLYIIRVVHKTDLVARSKILVVKE